jgi:hypothetical protein
MMRAGVVRSGALILVAVSLLGCGGGYLATSSRSFGSFTGRLLAGVSPGVDHVDCAWLEAKSGQRVEVMYPSSWDVRFHPVRVIDPSGRVFAHGGDQLQVTGPTDGIGASMCTADRPFQAETVVMVTP